MIRKVLIICVVVGAGAGVGRLDLRNLLRRHAVEYEAKEESRSLSSGGIPQSSVPQAVAAPGLTESERRLLADLLAVPESIGGAKSVTGRALEELFRRSPEETGAAIAQLDPQRVAWIASLMVRNGLQIDASPSLLKAAWCSPLELSPLKIPQLRGQLWDDNPAAARQVVASLAAEDPEALLGTVAARVDPYLPQSSELTGLYVDAWLQLDPAKAEVPVSLLSALNRISGPAKLDELNRIRLLAEDGNRAAAALLGAWLPDVGGRFPEVALQSLSSLDPETWTEGTIEAIGRDSRLINRLTDLLERTSPVVSDNIRAAMERGKLTADIGRMTEESSDREVIADRIVSFARDRPEESLEFLVGSGALGFDALREASLALDRAGIPNTILEPLVRKWAGFDVVGASEILSMAADPPDNAIVSLLDNISSDPEAQVIWASRISDKAVRESYMTRFLAELAEDDPARASELEIQLQSDHRID